MLLLTKTIIVDEGEFRRVIYLLGENVPLPTSQATKLFMEETFYVLPGVSSHVMKQSF